MFHYIMSAFVALLFFVLTPGVLVSLPPKGSKLVVAATHAVVFTLVFHFTHKMVWNISKMYEGFQNCTDDSQCPDGRSCNTNKGECM
jgi:hypothetical protein